ncbi:hypothetical protein QYF36_015239 [Acer negundo]|nr:hypothetical protein QYF36_015239 [Acer negundo]
MCSPSLFRFLLLLLLVMASMLCMHSTLVIADWKPRKLGSKVKPSPPPPPIPNMKKHHIPPETHLSLPITIAKDTLPEHKSPEDSYTLALHKALLFFNAQKSGKLPNNNGIPWKGDSGLNDGNTTTDMKGGLVRGCYDAGDNAKFHFPMSYAMTMLSWSLIEYNHKYKAIGEYDHIRELIKWGTDYLLLTFNSSATKIYQIHAQEGFTV